jgi:hypothetical protein
MYYNRLIRVIHVLEQSELLRVPPKGKGLVFVTPRRDLLIYVVSLSRAIGLCIDKPHREGLAFAENLL